jgi:hypothetical protein
MAMDARTLDRPIPSDPLAVFVAIESPPFWTDFDSRQSLREEIMVAILHPIAGTVHGDSLNCHEAI